MRKNFHIHSKTDLERKIYREGLYGDNESDNVTQIFDKLATPKGRKPFNVEIFVFQRIHRSERDALKPSMGVFDVAALNACDETEVSSSNR